MKQRKEIFQWDFGSWERGVHAEMKKIKKKEIIGDKGGEGGGGSRI